MRAVLGIDAAWTEGEPSGVALLVEETGSWRCVAVAPSYADYLHLAGGGSVDWGRRRIEGGPPEPSRLLDATRRLEPRADLLAIGVDMPLSRVAITGRRAADDEVSRRYGGFGCGTHSPSAQRPGPVSRSLRSAFEEQGFTLAVKGSARLPALLEVYPHPALLALTGENYRLQYKVSRSRRYWPHLGGPARARRLLGIWQRILGALRREMLLSLTLPVDPESLSGLKRYEDSVDALVCAWVAREFLEGRAECLGDDDAVIWVPAGAGSARGQAPFKATKTT